MSIKKFFEYFKPEASIEDVIKNYRGENWGINKSQIYFILHV